MPQAIKRSANSSSSSLTYVSLFNVFLYMQSKLLRVLTNLKSFLHLYLIFQNQIVDSVLNLFNCKEYFLLIRKNNFSLFSYFKSHYPIIARYQFSNSSNFREYLILKGLYAVVKNFFEICSRYIKDEYSKIITRTIFKSLCSLLL